MMLTNAVILGITAAALLNDKAIRSAPPIHYVDFVPAGFNALTIPPVGIFIHSKHRGNAELLQHELIHWQQYQREGLLPFWFNYAGGHIIHGYDANPYEIEARANESDFCKRNYSQCVRCGLAKTVYDPGFRL